MRRYENDFPINFQPDPKPNIVHETFGRGRRAKKHKKHKKYSINDVVVLNRDYHGLAKNTVVVVTDDQKDSNNTIEVMDGAGINCRIPTKYIRSLKIKSSIPKNLKEL